jgi:peptidoglycan/xylan/chitin deacetylase (PgdA/CDA1 family)
VSGIRSQMRDFAYRRVGGTAAVLIYHRVADLARDPQRLAVTPAHFEEQMAALAKSYTVIALHELIEGLKHRRVQKQAVVVTFDDGYADNLRAAAPVLAAHKVPATVFVSSGNMGSEREMWWDEVDRLVLSPGVLPETFTLTAEDETLSANLGADAEYSHARALTDAGWDVTQPAGNGRQRAYADACEFIRPLVPAAREDVLAQLRAIADASDTGRETHRTLTRDEVAALDALENIEVGGHTVNHPVLSALSADEQQIEIDADKRELEMVCGHELRTFSYPYGGLNAYTEASVAFVGEVGYEGACANHSGVVKPWTDPFRLPRLSVGDWDGATFEAKLKGWFDEPR